jgi:hypothetical protein
VRFPDMAEPPPGLDARITYRENRIEADCQTLERHRKVGHVNDFAVYCDESARVGGDNTAPSPLGYFTLGVGF